MFVSNYPIMGRALRLPLDEVHLSGLYPQQAHEHLSFNVQHAKTLVGQSVLQMLQECENGLEEAFHNPFVFSPSSYLSPSTSSSFLSYSSSGSDSIELERLLRPEKRR